MNILLLATPVLNVAEGTGSITKHIQGTFERSDYINVGFMPPLAIYHLKEILTMYHHNVTLIDPSYFQKIGFFFQRNNDELIIKGLLKEKNVVGISANTGNWATSRYMIELVKSLSPDIPVVLGGVHASYFDQYIMESTDVDFIIRGEGEVHLPRLINVIGQPRLYDTVGNLTYRGMNGEIKRTNNNSLLSVDELEKCPISNFDEVPEGKYMGLPLESSRGCKYNCRFCSVIHTRKWRGCSPKIVFNRIQKIYPIVKSKTTSKKWIYFTDDCFTANPTRALNILDIVNQYGLDLVFLMECRVNDLLENNFVKNLPKNLIGHMQIGVDAGYDDGLKIIRKGIKIKDVEECGNILYKNGLNECADLSYIIGFPWENIDHIITSIDTAAYFSKKYNIVSCINWYYYFPSNLWTLRKQYKIDIDEKIFDNPKYIIDIDTFYKSHPNITMDDFRTVSNKIQDYQESGVKISYKNLFN